MSSKKTPPKRASALKEHFDNGDDKEQEPMVPTGLLPSYLAEAFGELYAEDGLLVLGKGLGLLNLLASFVRFYSDVNDGHASLIEENNKGNKPPLIFVLGLREAERNALISILETWGTPPELLPTMITNESGQGKDRAGKMDIYIYSCACHIYCIVYPSDISSNHLSSGRACQKSCTIEVVCLSLQLASSLLIS
jgi:hypothetical protein